MKVLPLLTGLFVLLASVPGHAQTTTPPPLRAKVKQCTTGDSPLDRSATFEASMPREVEATTMALRFKLYSSTAGADYRRVSVSDFSNWTRSAPNVAGFIYDKHVNQLAAGVSYRVVVDFTWRDDDGKVIDRARRTSKPCRQPTG
jgi:hypothetical protein